jgi:predicted RNA polymerase sigma factor
MLSAGILTKIHLRVLMNFSVASVLSCFGLKPKNLTQRTQREARTLRVLGVPSRTPAHEKSA